MSIQTDCEMLSIEMMETYAKKYDLSGNEVVKLLQEYYQINFEEAVLRFYKSETYKIL